MRRTMVLMAVLTLSGLAGAQIQTDDCSVLGGNLGPFPTGNQNTNEHASGKHVWTNVMNGGCYYSGTASPYTQIGCSLTAQANSSTGMSESGFLINPLKTHQDNWGDVDGLATAGAGNGATAHAGDGGAVASCIGSCGINVTFSGSGTTGWSAQFGGGTPLWTQQRDYPNSCPGYTLAKIPCPSPTSPYPTTTNGTTYSWNHWTCSWTVSTGSTGGGTPIIIDTLKTGFSFSDPTKGAYVSFDLKGDGTLLKLSWPLPNSGNAWLVYDRDGDGIIKDGTELFGNFTPHSDGGIANHPNPNGFLALAWYDQPAQGGNLDLMIDKQDLIWAKLRLWIDGHCYQHPDMPCQSLPSELFPLESKGINSLSLVYSLNAKTDAVGNQFKFSAVLNPTSHDVPIDKHGHTCCELHEQSKDGRLTYDVFLVSVP